MKKRDAEHNDEFRVLYYGEFRYQKKNQRVNEPCI